MKKKTKITHSLVVSAKTLERLSDIAEEVLEQESIIFRLTDEEKVWTVYGDKGALKEYRVLHLGKKYRLERING